MAASLITDSLIPVSTPVSSSVAAQAPITAALRPRPAMPSRFWVTGLDTFADEFMHVGRPMAGESGAVVAVEPLMAINRPVPSQCLEMLCPRKCSVPGNALFQFGCGRSSGSVQLEARRGPEVWTIVVKTV
jgi:hypothetical protein